MSQSSHLNEEFFVIITTINIFNFASWHVSFKVFARRSIIGKKITDISLGGFCPATEKKNVVPSDTFNTLGTQGSDTN